MLAVDWLCCFSTRDLSQEDEICRSHCCRLWPSVANSGETSLQEEEISYPWRCLVRRAGLLWSPLSEVRVCKSHWKIIPRNILFRPRSTEYEVLTVDGGEDDQKNADVNFRKAKKGKSKRRSDSPSISPTKIKKLKLVLGSETMSTVNYSD